MKKIYISPDITVLRLQGMQMISTSGVTSSLGIGYGGVDDEGLDPSVKGYNIIWDDEW